MRQAVAAMSPNYNQINRLNSSGLRAENEQLAVHVRLDPNAETHTGPGETNQIARQSSVREQ